jgi:hypothetical protein
MMKNNLGWIVALILVAGQPVLSAVPQLCLWDMYALAAVAGRCAHGHFWVSDAEVVESATAIANEMIKRRSK